MRGINTWQMIRACRPFGENQYTHVMGHEIAFTFHVMEHPVMLHSQSVLRLTWFINNVVKANVRLQLVYKGKFSQSLLSNVKRCKNGFMCEYFASNIIIVWLIPLMKTMLFTCDISILFILIMVILLFCKKNLIHYVGYFRFFTFLMVQYFSISESSSIRTLEKEVLNGYPLAISKILLTE